MSSKVVVLSNPVGPIIVDGLNGNGSVRWFLNKSVYAQSQSQADSMFSLLTLQDTPDGDTLFLDVLSSVDSRDLIGVLISISIPYRTSCIVNQVSGTTNVSYLGATLRGVTLGTTTVTGHNGSVFLRGNGGDISAEVQIPDSGFCSILTNPGNITLRIPQSTSAQVNLTAPGLITYSSLAFTDTVKTATTFSGKLGLATGLIELATTDGSITLIGL